MKKLAFVFCLLIQVKIVYAETSLSTHGHLEPQSITGTHTDNRPSIPTNEQTHIKKEKDKADKALKILTEQIQGHPSEEDTVFDELDTLESARRAYEENLSYNTRHLFKNFSDTTLDLQERLSLLVLKDAFKRNSEKLFKAFPHYRWALSTEVDQIIKLFDILIQPDPIQKKDAKNKERDYRKEARADLSFSLNYFTELLQLPIIRNLHRLRSVEDLNAFKKAFLNQKNIAAKNTISKNSRYANLPNPVKTLQHLVDRYQITEAKEN